MAISQYMTPSVHAVEPNHSMAAAHRLMRRHQIRHLPIIDEGKLVGVVTQRDLYFIESLGDAPDETIPVSEAMQEDVEVATPASPIAEVAKTMIDKRIGCVVVMEDEKVCGIFTTIDALQALMELTDLSDQILDGGDS
jgi:acetoin utilization protein AcuB